MSEFEPTVFVVEDDADVRNYLCRLVEGEGMRSEAFPQANAFLEAVSADRPGCVVADLVMPGMSGIELHEAMLKRNLSLPIIVITGKGDIGTAVQAMKGGALDFIEKPIEGDKLIASIRHAFQIDKVERQQQANRATVEARIASLTDRERQVLEEIIDGNSNKQVAYRLNITIKTVEKHRASLMRKLMAENAVDLARIYLSATQARREKTT